LGAGGSLEKLKKSTLTVMLSGFAPLRIALSVAKRLTVNSAKHPRIFQPKQIQGFFVACAPQNDMRRDWPGGIKFFTASEDLKLRKDTQTSSAPRQIASENDGVEAPALEPTVTPSMVFQNRRK
jgi:hypothetical protein